MITNAGILCPEVTMKKFISLMLCLLFCVGALAGCGGLDEEEKGANIRVYLTDYPYTLDPAVIQVNSDVEQILSLIFEPLTTIDEDGKVIPCLATEWYYKYDEIYQLHKMYFELKDTKWSDNRTVTADDVIYAWRRILSPEIDSPYASLLYAINGARDVKSGVGTIDDLGLAAVDDTLLEVTFSTDLFGTEEADQLAAAEYCQLFAEQVANVHLAPSREDIVTRYEKAGEDWAGNAANIVCNGPFRVQSMDMPREKRENEEDFSGKFACKLVLERNAYYMRDAEEDALDKYVLPYRITCYYMEGQYEYYEDATDQTQKFFQAKRYIDGELYFLSSFEKETYEYFKEDIETQQTLNGYAFYFNTASEALKDANVRKALSLALDRNDITANVTGTGEVPATGYVPTGVFDVDYKSDFREVGGNLYNTAADPDGAKALLSGKKGSFTIKYLVPQNDYTVKTYRKINYANVYENVAKAAAESWKKLGFDVTCEGLDPTEYVEALTTRNYDVIGVNILSGSVDAFGYLAPFAKEYSGTSVVVDNATATLEEIFNPHYTNIDDADYSNLITSALKATNRADRAKLLHDAEAKLVELCPATMVFWYSRSFVANDKMIDGYDTDSYFGYIDFTELELDDWRDVNASEDAVSIARNPEE
ncbi:MAG: hypothetical protein E7595_04610 [Ruminococcaceae bacterium]|nr:hypothetical protein [Oscillospiraceae bacterium]